MGAKTGTNMDHRDINIGEKEVTESEKSVFCYAGKTSQRWVQVADVLMELNG